MKNIIAIALGVPYLCGKYILLILLTAFLAALGFVILLALPTILRFLAHMIIVYVGFSVMWIIFVGVIYLIAKCVSVVKGE
ncbi:MAG TPA: hypothetical protein VII99_10610 [Bacteroidia bacterium]